MFPRNRVKPLRTIQCWIKTLPNLVKASIEEKEFEQRRGDDIQGKYANKIENSSFEG